MSQSIMITSILSSFFSLCMYLADANPLEILQNSGFQANGWSIETDGEAFLYYANPNEEMKYLLSQLEVRKDGCRAVSYHIHIVFRGEQHKHRDLWDSMSNLWTEFIDEFKLQDAQGVWGEEEGNPKMSNGSPVDYAAFWRDHDPPSNHELDPNGQPPFKNSVDFGFHIPMKFGVSEFGSKQKVIFVGLHEIPIMAALKWWMAKRQQAIRALPESRLEKLPADLRKLVGPGWDIMVHPNTNLSDQDEPRNKYPNRDNEVALDHISRDFQPLGRSFWVGHRLQLSDNPVEHKFGAREIQEIPEIVEYVSKFVRVDVAVGSLPHLVKSGELFYVTHELKDEWMKRGEQAVREQKEGKMKVVESKL